MGSRAQFIHLWPHQPMARTQNHQCSTTSSVHCAQPYLYIHFRTHCYCSRSYRTITVHRLGLLTLLEHRSERSQEDRPGSSGRFFSGFRETAMPREQSRSAPTLAGDGRVPRLCKVTDILLFHWEQRMNLFITLLVVGFFFFSRCSKNRKKSG